jgi:uncharacterized protein (TIGR03435 family)
MEAALTDSSLLNLVTSQLGLKLQARKSAHEMLVIDRVEKPSEN